MNTFDGSSMKVTKGSMSRTVGIDTFISGTGVFTTAEHLVLG